MATITVTIALTVVMSSRLRSADVHREFSYAKRVIARDLDVNVRPRFRRRPLPVPDLAREAVAVWDYAPYAARTGDRTFFIPEPARDEHGLKVGSGQATICGQIGVASFGPRAGWVRYAITHELGHMLGASHRPGLNVMNPDPIGVGLLGDGGFRFSEESREEVRNCL